MFISTKLCIKRLPCVLFGKHLDRDCDCFIIITSILFTATLSLILIRRAKRLKTVTNAEETDMGGYYSPVGEANMDQIMKFLARILFMCILRCKIWT